VDELGHCRDLLFCETIQMEPSLSRVKKVVRFQKVGKTFMDKSLNEFTDAAE